jgi:hypothetical protein
MSHETSPFLERLTSRIDEDVPPAPDGKPSTSCSIRGNKRVVARILDTLLKTHSVVSSALCRAGDNLVVVVAMRPGYRRP